jgi:hypothetical protein
LAGQRGDEEFHCRTTPFLGSPLDHPLNILCGETFDDTNGCILP